MRTLVTLMAALLLVPAIAAADDQGTLRGCLMQMGEDFILTDAAGTKYEIDGMNAQLKQNLGSVVEITGEFEGRSRDKKHHAIKLDAKEIRKLSDSCSMAALDARPQTFGDGRGMYCRQCEPATATGVMTGAPIRTSGVDIGKRLIRGCVSRVGDHYVLTEEGTHTTYRLDGEHDKLRNHVAHFVELQGDAEQLNEVSSSGAQMEFDVEEVRFLESSCPVSLSK